MKNANLSQNTIFKNIFNLPSVIVASVEAVDKYLPDLLKKWARCNEERTRALRIDHINNVCTVLKFLIIHFDCMSSLIVDFTENGKKVNYTNSKMIKMCNMSKSTFYDCLNDLKNLGLYHTSSQKYQVKKIKGINTRQCRFFSIQKTITPLFFLYFGTAESLADYKKWLIEHHKDQDNEVLPQFRIKILNRKFNTSKPIPQQLSLYTQRGSGSISPEKNNPPQTMKEYIESHGFTESEIEDLNHYDLNSLYQKMKENPEDLKWSRLFLMRQMLDRIRRE